MRRFTKVTLSEQTYVYQLLKDIVLKSYVIKCLTSKPYYKAIRVNIMHKLCEVTLEYVQCQFCKDKYHPIAKHR